MTGVTAPRLSRAEREALAVANDPVLEHMLAEERVEAEALDTALLGRLLGYLRPHRALSLAAIALATLEALLMTVPPYLIGLAIDQVTVGRARRQQGLSGWLEGASEVAAGWLSGVMSHPAAVVAFFGVVVGLVTIARWWVATTTAYQVQKLGQRVVHDLRVEVYRHVTGLDLGYFHRNPVGRLVNRTTFDIQTLSELFSDAVAQGARDLIFLVVLVVVMLSLDVPLALVLILSLPLLIVIGLVYRRAARPALRTMSAVLSRMNSWLAENLAGMRENHLYRREGRRVAEFGALTAAHQSSITRVIQAWGLLRPAMLLVSAVATALVLFIGYARVVDHIVTLGLLLTFVQYTTYLWRPVRNLTEKFNLIQTALTAGERVLDVLETPSQMVDRADADPRALVERGAITFRDVWFRYSESGDDVLRGISFEARAGETMALVGDTGGGKSTIAHLISRFYDPTRGEVLIDGRPVHAYTLAALRSSIALVPQDVVVFAATLRENIALGADVADEVLLEAARAVHADALIERFSEGLDHVLEEGGRTLSTGERQLLSFARALVVNPPILLLDEATANIDSRTERHLQDALARLTVGRTSVVIAHRLSTIREADQIVVVRQGRLVERGRHDELLALDGEYARLHRIHMAND